MVTVEVRIETTFAHSKVRKRLADWQIQEATLLKTPVLAHLDAKPLSAHSRWIYVSFNPSTEQSLLETVLLLLQTAARCPGQRWGLKLPFSFILYCIHFMFSSMGEDEWSCRIIPEDNDPLYHSPYSLLCPGFDFYLLRSDLEPLCSQESRGCVMKDFRSRRVHKYWSLAFHKYWSWHFWDIGPFCLFIKAQ